MDILKDIGIFDGSNIWVSLLYLCSPASKLTTEERLLAGRVTPELLEKYRYGTGAMITYTTGKSTCRDLEAMEQIKYAVLERSGKISVIPR